MKIERYFRTGLTATALIWMILLPTLFTGCKETEQPSKNTSQKKMALVGVEPVETGDIARTIELTGTVVPYRMARLASPAQGPVVNLTVREGDLVKAGTILLAIGRKAGADALIASLREDLAKEENNLKRTQQLVASDALPGEQLEQARASFERVKAQLANAEESARDYYISAPWSGVVSKVLVTDGDFVSPRAPLVEIYDPSSLIIRAGVPEKETTLIDEVCRAADVKPGCRDIAASLRLDAYPDKHFSGRIIRMYPYLDERMRTRTIELIPNETVNLLPGMFSRIRLMLEFVSGVVTVPVQAVVVTPAGVQTAFIAADGKAVQRKIQTGIEDGGRIQIISGLNPGEQVIVSGQEKLKDGAEIRLFVPPVDGQSKGKPDEALHGKKPEKIGDAGR